VDDRMDKKAPILMEALPYFQKFKTKRWLSNTAGQRWTDRLSR
jgi:hypothetical protein